MSTTPLPSDLPAPASGVFAGGVHHYLRYMERARSDMLRLIGIDQRGALDSGEGVYAVTRVALDYRLPARLDDDLIVVSRVETVTGATVTIAQDVMRGGDLLTRGEVRVAFLSPQGRPKRQPKSWVALFTRIAQGEDVCP